MMVGRCLALSEPARMSYRSSRRAGLVVRLYQARLMLNQDALQGIDLTIQ